MGEPEQMPPTWSKDGQTLYFPVVLHGSSLLMKIGLDGSKLQTRDRRGRRGWQLLPRSSQSDLAYFYGKMDDPGQVMCAEM